MNIIDSILQSLNDNLSTTHGIRTWLSYFAGDGSEAAKLQRRNWKHRKRLRQISRASRKRNRI